MTLVRASTRSSSTRRGHAGLSILLGAIGIFAACASLPRRLSGQDEYDSEPIRYRTAEVSDPVARLQKRLDRGEVSLKHQGERGYLKSLLDALDLPVSSQGLVFSKTSFQRDRIHPQTPRSVYFGDSVYVGWVPGGSLIEISSVDPRQGAIFYTLDQTKSERPRFLRLNDECLQCHSSSLTRGVPGHLVRSVFPDPRGLPVLRAGTFVVDHTTPLQNRWGGWYVTGTHGEQTHMGNAFLTGSDQPEDLDRKSGANLTDLGSRLDTSRYLSPHSDIVALMVLEHQSKMHNLITFANFQSRIALRDQDIMNRTLGKPPGHRLESTRRRIESATRRLIDYMLFVGEAPLKETVTGTSDFSSEFSARGPRDGQGRSLRDFDLQSRLFKYPCSFLIYTEAFDGLPDPTRNVIYEKLWAILKGEERDEKYDHLSQEDRSAILEILAATKEGLPESWKVEKKTATF